MSWCARVFFLLLSGISIALLISGAACTRRGKTSVLPATASPSTTIYASVITGSDTSGDGSAAKPFKTLTRALAAVAKSTVPNLTVQLGVGTYNASAGEKFPIVVNNAVTITGTSYGAGPSQNRGTFIDGYGEDLNLERLLGRPSSKIAFVTLEVPKSITTEVSVTNLYVGSSQAAPGSSASYASVDALGPLAASHVSFAAASRLTLPRIAGVIVPSGTLNCSACIIRGSDNALVALSLPSGNSPTITLSGQPSQSIIGGATGINTDATASIAVSFQTFQSTRYGYRDAIVPVIPSASLGTVDFGQGSLGSSGGNILIGARSVISEISITVPGVLVTALGNTWNLSTQGTNAQGQYPFARTFGPGATGRNVTVAAAAAGAAVMVGPVPPPTPTPSPSPSTSPTSSPT